MNTRMPRFPRIAYSAADPVSPDVAPRMLSCPPDSAEHVFEQVAQQLHRQVLERECRTVGQFQNMEAGLERLDRGYVGASERRCGVGALDETLEVRLGNVIGESPQDLESESRI